jgi:hypothetical protein
MTIVPFEPEHLAAIHLQPAQISLQPTLMQPEYGPALQAAGPCYSAMVDDQVIACAGFYPQWEGRAIVWALISASAGRHFFALHKAVLRTFNAHGYRRLETAVVVGFVEGERWARMLGFICEGRMRGYMPDGTDCDLYARVT